MSDNIIINKKISIESQYLNKNIKDNILKKLKEMLKDECTKENGYFIDIIRINKIKDNYISSNCENIFDIEFEAEILKPEKDKIFEGDICMIFSGGIFVNIKNKIKVLIPLNSLTEYSFNSKNNSFIKNKKELKQGDIIYVLISGTKYNKKNFSCFGTIVDKKV
jgi:DNA-directed RNA polymerase subunit E'/Rpb7